MPLSAIRGGRIPLELWAPLGTIPEALLGELRDAAKLPWVFHHVAAAVPGRVLASSGAMPAATGVLGDGALLQETGVRLRDFGMSGVERRLAEVAPRSRTAQSCAPCSDKGLSRDIKSVSAEAASLACSVNVDAARAQLGALGDGFVGLYADERDVIWIGVRSAGGALGAVVQYRHEAAAADAAHNDHLPRRDLAVLLAGSDALQRYVRDASWVQRYASINRRVIAHRVGTALFGVLDSAVSHSVYNSITAESHFGASVFLARRAAARAWLGDRIAVLQREGPGYVLRGRGCADSFMSAFVDADLTLQHDLVEVIYRLRPLVRIGVVEGT